MLPADGNAPGLAFSIFDDEEDQYDDSVTMMDRSDLGYQTLEPTDPGDRGNVVVDIPAQVLPYMPRAIQRSLYVEAPANKITSRHAAVDIKPLDISRQESKPEDNSADFHSFETVAGADDGLNIRKVHDIRLTSEQLQGEGPLLLSVGSSLSYGPNQPGVGTHLATSAALFMFLISVASGGGFSGSAGVFVPTDVTGSRWD